MSDIAIRALDVIHTTTGLPWYATIFVTTVAVRTAMFPFTIKGVRNTTVVPFDIVLTENVR